MHFFPQNPLSSSQTDDAQELDLAMPMYNLIGHNSNYSDTTGILWFNSKDEATNFDVNIADKNNFKSFKYKTKLFENTAVDGDNSMLKNAAVTAPLKYLSNFWGLLEMSLIYHKVELKLTWKKYCVLARVGNDVADSGNIICIIKDTKLYVPVVILILRYYQKLQRHH